MDQVAQQILSSNLVTDRFGVDYPLHSHTSKEQGKVIQQIIKKFKPKISIEIGLAYGISTLFICEALKDVNAKTHIVIDPYQKDWKGIGLKNIKEAGYESLVDFRPQFSHEVLPQLLNNKSQVDLAYLDTTKVFDIVLVDIFYLTKLLNVGGIIILDDCYWPGIRKVCTFLAKHPSFEIVLTWQENQKRRLGRYLTRPLQSFVDEKLGINAHCIGFQKIEEDKRHWTWFENF